MVPNLWAENIMPTNPWHPTHKIKQPEKPRPEVKNAATEIG